MSETTPNSKGPAQVQMTPEQAARFGLTPTPDGTPQRVPASEVKPEEVATLAIEYRDGQPVIVATGGKYIPTRIGVTGSDSRTYGSDFVDYQLVWNDAGSGNATDFALWKQ